MPNLTCTHALMIASVLLLQSACARPAPPRTLPYREFAKHLGLGDPSAPVVIADGQMLGLTVVSERTGEPVEGVRVFLGAVEIHGSGGRFLVPVSKALFEQNPALRIERPKGYEERIRFEFAWTMSVHCDGKQAVLARVDLADFAEVSVGVDRVYVEPPLTAVDAEHLVRLLEQLRVHLGTWTGVSPPPMAIAMTRDDLPDRYGVPDADGRTVWVAKRSRSKEGAFVGLMAHEWTHLTLNSVRFPDDPELRYVEDGLADLVGHMAEQKLLAGDVSPILENRRWSLEQRKDTSQVDLFALAQRYSVPEQPGSWSSTLCVPGVIDGYALGLAYWVHRTGADAQAVRAAFDLFVGQRPARASDVEALLSASGTSPRSFTLQDARAWLNAI